MTSFNSPPAPLQPRGVCCAFRFFLLHLLALAASLISRPIGLIAFADQIRGEAVINTPLSFLRGSRPATELKFDLLPESTALRDYQCAKEREFAAAYSNHDRRTTSKKTPDAGNDREYFYSVGMTRGQIGTTVGTWPFRPKASASILPSVVEHKKQDLLVEEEAEIRRKTLVQLDPRNAAFGLYSHAMLSTAEREEIRRSGRVSEAGASAAAAWEQHQLREDALPDGEGGPQAGEPEPLVNNNNLQLFPERVAGRSAHGGGGGGNSAALPEPENVLFETFRDVSKVGAATSSKLHHDLIKHFRFRGQRNETVLEMGCANGFTTRILVRLFAKVICLEKRPKFTRALIPNYPNLIKLNYDLYQENWGYALASTPIHVVFIDALHDYAAVLFDIKAVLAKISCCVHTMAFHDFYFPGVAKAIEDAGVWKYFGKSWNHLGTGFPDNWRADRNHHVEERVEDLEEAAPPEGGDLLEMEGERNSTKTDLHGLEDGVIHEERHFLDPMVEPYTRQCPPALVSSPAGAEQTTAQAQGTAESPSPGSSRASTKSKRPLRAGGKPLLGLNFDVPEETTLGPDARNNHERTRTPWVYEDQRSTRLAPKYTFFPTHPEGLLVQLKEKFVPSAKPTASWADIRRLEDYYSTLFACNLVDQRRQEGMLVEAAGVEKVCTPERRRSIMELPEDTDNKPLLLREEVVYYKPAGVREKLREQKRKATAGEAGRGEQGGVFDYLRQVDLPDEAALRATTASGLSETADRFLDGNPPEAVRGGGATVMGMILDLERKLDRGLRVRPFFKNQMRIDLLNYGAYAVQDMGWQLNKARYLHQHVHPQFPKLMRDALPHIFEGGAPGSLLRVSHFVQFLPNGVFRMVGGNDKLTWANARLLRALLEGSVVTPETVAQASKMLLKDQDRAFLGKEAVGFPNTVGSKIVNTDPADASNNPRLYEDRAPFTTDPAKGYVDYADGVSVVDPELRLEGEGGQTVEEPDAESAEEIRQKMGRPMLIVSGRWYASDVNANVVYLLFQVGKQLENSKRPAVLLGNGTAWMLQFTSSRSSFTVIDILNLGKEWVVGPEKDPTNGGGAINYVGFSYQQMFRLVTQVNDEFADEGTLELGGDMDRQKTMAERFR